MFHKSHKHKLNVKIDRIIIFILIFLLPAFMIIRFDFTKYIGTNYDGIEVSGTMLGVWGAMLGFMITAMSIIMTLGDGDFIKVIRGSSHFKTIMFIIILTCMMLFASTAFGAFVVCFNYWNNLCTKLLLYFLFGTGIAILLSMFFIFYLVVNSNNKNE